MSQSNLSSGGGGGGGTGGTTDDGSTDGSTDTGGGGGFFSNPLSDYTDVLTAFGSNPRNFILGAVLTTILETVTGAVTTAVDQIILLVGGSQPARFNAPGERIGFADLPVAIASTLADAGGFGGRAIIDGIEAFNGTLFEAAAAAGPFAPLVIIVIGSIEAVVVIVVLRRIVYVIADLLQLGGLTE